VRWNFIPRFAPEEEEDEEDGLTRIQEKEEKEGIGQGRRRRL